jgi:hypothetical protein
MNSGSYFSNLIPTRFSYSAGCGVDQCDDEPDDTPPHDEAPIAEGALATAKDEKRTRNFSIDEHKLLISGWVSVS